MAEAPWITEEVKDKDGKVVTRQLDERELPPGVNMSRKAVLGAMAAQSVRDAGGSEKDALDAAIKSRNSVPDEPEPQAQELSPEVEAMIKYVHAIARLHSGRFEDLTPLGMLEVAMLCPYPVVTFEEWNEKMRQTRG